MRKFNFKILIIVALSAFAMSCNKTATVKTLPDPVIEKTVKKSELEKEIDIKRSYCFRNETRFKENSEDVDILELKLDVIGNSVSGIYNWLPKFKDRREGTITGLIEDDIIQGKYKFTQEGKTATVPIVIQLNEDSVIISEDANGIGIGGTINRTNCSL
ncbi:hypothetical protein JM83_3568 [Gillisia sp. Hel_I_86]|uniref:hypothetical protein n=1 Tax=Gillisia sp. Hel_I_86 TaxID=1249981 RepID=UPI0011994683|nr:hypothetical protein [Gillisia sp. Hel_I_86]TVZ28438.1 hypothetical protein JM83_3568 [Gillisia sp. Hel_I_86]